MADEQGTLARIRQEMEEAMAAVRAKYTSLIEDYQRRMDESVDPTSEAAHLEKMGITPEESAAFDRGTLEDDPAFQEERRAAQKMRMDGMGAGPMPTED